MSWYLEQLKETGLNLLIYNGRDIVFSSALGGIKPLLDAIDAIGRDRLRGTVVADKIVGRAAALLTLYTVADEVHAALISTSAKEVLHSHGLKFYFSEETPTIMNRNETDMCPFEKLVQEVDNPEEAYRRIKANVSGI